MSFSSGKIYVSIFRYKVIFIEAILIPSWVVSIIPYRNSSFCKNIKEFKVLRLICIDSIYLLFIYNKCVYIYIYIYIYICTYILFFFKWTSLSFPPLPSTRVLKDLFRLPKEMPLFSIIIIWVLVLKVITITS